MRAVFAACVLAGVLASPVAAAQTCVRGRVSNDLTLWHCCWPGQVWQDDPPQCIGPPICPGSLVPRGNECIRVTPCAVCAYPSDQSIEYEHPYRFQRGTRLPQFHHLEHEGHQTLMLGTDIAALTLAIATTGALVDLPDSQGWSLAWFIPVVGAPIGGAINGAVHTDRQGIGLGIGIAVGTVGMLAEISAIVLFIDYAFQPLMVVQDGDHLHRARPSIASRVRWIGNGIAF